jgi:ABC-type multidrug transport system fused ATPase/permease subunit
MGKYQSHNYLKDIVTVWEDKKYKYKKHIALILAGFRSNLDSVIYVVIFSFLRSGLKVIQMTLFREYMKMFGTASTELSPFIYGITFTHTQIGVMYLLVRLIEIFVLRKGYEYQAFLGHKSSVEFNCLIFAKLLRVSPSSTKDKARSGEIMNFLQVDAQKLRFLMSSSPDLITMPILIVTYSYMLFQFFGVAFFYGLGTMLLFFMLNFIFGQNSTRQVLSIKSSLIIKPGLPMEYIVLTKSDRDFLASVPSLQSQLAVVIDIKRFEKLKGTPPLFVRINMSNTLSISCLVSR